MPVGPPGQPWSRPLVTFLGVPPFLALIETVTIAVHLQNMNVVGEAVEQCPRQAFGAEHFGPLVEGKIASQQCGATLITLTEHLNPHLTHGEIWLDHKPLHIMKAHEAARNGIGLVPEDRRIIQGLTVEENLKLAQIAPPVGWSLERIYELFPRLGERRTQEGTTLSGGEQQMLAISRALARDVKLLLLDEPYEGLAPVIVQEIERTLEQIKQLGMTTIIVEQNAIAALHLADRAIILDMG